MAVVFWLDSGRVEQIANYTALYGRIARHTISDVIQNEAGTLIEDNIRKLMPVSNVKPWKGKLPHAAHSKSLRHSGVNDLAIVVRTTKNYQYLYFPDDGTSTSNHIGKNGVPQQFFLRGAEASVDEVMNRCVTKLVEKFNEGV